MQNILFETFFIVFLAEMGDKSQLLMIAMTAEYKLRHILIGTALSILTLTLLAVAAGTLIGEFLPQTAISLIAGAAFLLFAYLGVGDEREEASSRDKKRGAILSVFGTYFLAELGDKTQLSALALSAGASGGFWVSAMPVFCGSAIALYLADLFGLLAGVLLNKRLPKDAFRAVSVVLFFVCGVLRLLEGFSDLFSVHGYAIAATVFLSVLFVILSATRLHFHRSARRGDSTDDTGRAKSVFV